MLSALLTVLSFFVIYLLIGVIVFGFLYVYSDTGSEWDITNIDCDDQILVWILWVVFLIIFLFQRISKQYIRLLKNIRNDVLKNNKNTLTNKNNDIK